MRPLTGASVAGESECVTGIMGHAVCHIHGRKAGAIQ